MGDAFVSSIVSRTAHAAELYLQALHSTSTEGPWLQLKLDAIYELGLALGVLLAFAVIVYGGIRYMLSGGNPAGQSDAREWIRHALFGLLLLAGAAIVLSTINPEVFQPD